MSTLEQVKLLETKVAKAIDYVNRLTGENAMLREKLAGYQTRIDELEVLVTQFKDDQGRIESGILSALDRLNQFEDAIEKGISRIIPKEEKIVSQPIEPLSVSPIEETALFSETSPAENSDEVLEGDSSSDDAAIMAALEAEESAVKARNSAEQPPEAELDIF
jgi:chromosome segregation ATPase